MSFNKTQTDLYPMYTIVCHCNALCMRIVFTNKMTVKEKQKKKNKIYKGTALLLFCALLFKFVHTIECVRNECRTFSTLKCPLDDRVSIQLTSEQK